MNTNYIILKNANMKRSPTVTITARQPSVKIQAISIPYQPKHRYTTNPVLIPARALPLLPVLDKPVNLIRLAIIGRPLNDVRPLIILSF